MLNNNRQSLLLEPTTIENFGEWVSQCIGKDLCLVAFSSASTKR
jgi:hypothetical protein